VQWTLTPLPMTWLARRRCPETTPAASDRRTSH